MTRFFQQGVAWKIQSSILKNVCAIEVLEERVFDHIARNQIIVFFQHIRPWRSQEISYLCFQPFIHWRLQLYYMKKSRSTRCWILLIQCEGDLLIFRCVMTAYSRLSFGALRLCAEAYLCVYVSVLFKARHDRWI